MEPEYIRWLSRLKAGDTVWIEHTWSRKRPEKAIVTKVTKRPSFTHIHTDIGFIVTEIGRCTTNYHWARKTEAECANAPRR